MTQPAEPAPGAPAPTPAPDPRDPTPVDPNEKVDVAALPPNVQQLISNLRQEAAANRTRAKQTAAEQAKAEVLQQIAGALGIAEAPTDPQALAEQLASTQIAEASARLELDVYRTAHRLGADADRLLDSRRFAAEVDALPEEGFQQGLEALIKQWAERDPSLRAAGATAAAARQPVEALRSGALPASEQQPVDPNEWFRSKFQR